MSVTIGIDARTFSFPDTATRGIGHYSVHHLTAAAKLTPDWNYVLFLDEPSETDFTKKLTQLPNIRTTTYDETDASQMNLFHLPDPMSIMMCYDSPFRVAPQKVPQTVLFYDLIPITLPDLHFKCWAERTKMGYRMRLKSLKQSKAEVFAISECTKNDLIQHAGIPGERITTIMAGTNQSDIPSNPSSEEIMQTLDKFGLSWPYFLVVGALDGHKNFETITAAFYNAKIKCSMQLAVVGSVKFDPTKIRFKQKLEADNVTGVVFTDYVSRRELECLYSSATALLFPSLYEGFGFPVLEAMANGCPVVCSNAASIPEVAGDAAVLLPPNDRRAFMEVMIELASVGPSSEIRTHLVSKGREQAKKFTWDQTAQKTIEVWKRLL